MLFGGSWTHLVWTRLQLARPKLDRCSAIFVRSGQRLARPSFRNPGQVPRGGGAGTGGGWARAGPSGPGGAGFFGLHSQRETTNDLQSSPAMCAPTFDRLPSDEVGFYEKRPLVEANFLKLYPSGIIANWHIRGPDIPDLEPYGPKPNRPHSHCGCG